MRAAGLSRRKHIFVSRGAHQSDPHRNYGGWTLVLLIPTVLFMDRFNRICTTCSIMLLNVILIGSHRFRMSRKGIAGLRLKGMRRPKVRSKFFEPFFFFVVPESLPCWYRRLVVVV